MLEELSGKSDKLCEAVLVDMHSESNSVLPTFAAVDEKGTFRLFNHLHVQRIIYDDAECLNFDNIMPNWREVPLPSRSDWVHIGGEQYTADVPAELEELFAETVDWQTERRTSGDGESERSGAEENELDPDVHAQQKRVEDAIRMVKEHPLHESGDGAKAQRAKLAASQVEAALAGNNERKRIRKRARRKSNTLANDGSDIVEEEEEEDGTWGDFMAIVSVLQTYGFLDDEYAVTSMGELGAKVKAEHELWTALVVMDPSLETVSPAHLGAVLGATQIDSGRSDSYVAYEPSAAILKATAGLLPLRSRLAAVQAEFGVEFGMLLDVEMTGIIEAWASGVSWFELLSSTSLQEGDVCRMLRRVLDLLRQIPRLPGLSDKMKKKREKGYISFRPFPSYR